MPVTFLNIPSIMPKWDQMASLINMTCPSTDISNSEILPDFSFRFLWQAWQCYLACCQVNNVHTASYCTWQPGNDSCVISRRHHQTIISGVCYSNPINNALSASCMMHSIFSNIISLQITLYYLSTSTAHSLTGLIGTILGQVTQKGLSSANYVDFKQLVTKPDCICGSCECIRSWTDHITRVIFTTFPEGWPQ